MPSQKIRVAGMEETGVYNDYQKSHNTTVESDTSQESEESWAMVWDTFMNKTTIHGFQHILGFRRRKIHG